MKHLYYFILVACFSQLPLFAQQSDTVTSTLKEEGYFRFTYDNDFFSATDRYYTQGIMIDLANRFVKKSPVSYLLVRLPKSNLNYYGLRFEQDVFTPKSIRYMGGQVYVGERPFTAVFFVSHQLTSISLANNQLLGTQLDLGILGPYAKGEEEQKGIHKALDNIEPQGWQNQLSTDIVINYRARFEKAFIHKKHFALVANINTRLGTLYTDATLGLRIQFGLFNAWHNYIPKGATSSMNKKFRAFLYSTIQAKAVAYNATLQGGLTNGGNIYQLPAAAITKQVYEASAGLLISYKNLSLEYARFYLSPEFAGGAEHGWGRCCISVRF